MPEFSYEAMASTGVRSQGTLTANSEREVMTMLDARGMFPIRIAASKAVSLGGKSGKRIKKGVLANFYSQLADLLHSGVPLLRSIELLQRQTTNLAFSEVLKEVRAKVADGLSLAESMARHPRAFDELAVSMVRAGQEGGFLEDVLRRIADFTEHQEELKAKVVGAVAYPVILAIIGTLVLTVLMVFFVPKFEPIFKKLEEKGELPVATVVVVGISHILGSWIGLLMLGFLVFGFFGFKAWAATESGRASLDAFKLRLPGAGKIFLSLAISRFTRILGTLLHNGIPILQSLRIAKDSAGNKVVADAIEKSAENIKAGDSLAKPLAASQHFPRDIVEMVAVGEESNNLETVLLNISTTLEKRTTRQLDLFVRLLEPIMLLFMAVITGIVVAALLLPVFKMSSSVS
jgi:general secretion pathway protein F/type IV pilus assembly protein PilC